MGSGPTSSPMMAAPRRPSTSYVLASLRLHVELVLAGGKDPALSGWCAPSRALLILFRAARMSSGRGRRR